MSICKYMGIQLYRVIYANASLSLFVSLKADLFLSDTQIRCHGTYDCCTTRAQTD